MEIEQNILGFTSSDEAVVLYTMTNKANAKLRVINIGAAITSIEVPDREGKMRDVALGYRFFEQYIGDGPAMGKSVGRVANRIAGGRFTLEGVEYKLATNDGPNHLHGGANGFANKIWTSRVEGDRVVFSYTSPSSEEGYPGELGAEIAYDWNDDCEVGITLFAGCDSTTIVNLTNHSYFNLNGEGSGDILSHTLKLNASKYLAADNTGIPTGEFNDVKGTPMDFTSTKEIGKDINADFEPLKARRGYDHCLPIDGYSKSKLSYVGELYSADSGILMTIASTQPSVQLYTGNWLDNSGEDKNGKPHFNHSGVALECQNLTDAINKPNFPSPILKAGEVYSEYISYTFSVK